MKIYTVTREYEGLVEGTTVFIDVTKCKHEIISSYDEMVKAHGQSGEKLSYFMEPMELYNKYLDYIQTKMDNINDDMIHVQEHDFPSLVLDQL